MCILITAPLVLYRNVKPNNQYQKKLKHNLQVTKVPIVELPLEIFYGNYQKPDVFVKQNTK